jgi:2'-5' RNA ligase
VSERLRLFVALDLPPEVRAELAAWCDRAAPEAVRRVPEANLHVTLAFLGTRAAADAQAVAALLPALATAHPPGALATAGALWLPPRRPGVLTVEVVTHDALRALHSALVEELRSAVAFAPERRAFRAHVTVGRVARAARLRPPAVDPPPALTFAADGVTLYRSHTGRGGSRYEPLARVGFA